jgi:hypothetical protein
MASRSHQRSNHAGTVPSVPEPSSRSASNGMDVGRELARCFVPDNVRLWAALAFGADAEVSLWTRLQATRLIAEFAGAIGQRPLGAPLPLLDERADGRDRD